MTALDMIDLEDTTLAPLVGAYNRYADSISDAMNTLMDEASKLDKEGTDLNMSEVINMVLTPFGEAMGHILATVPFPVREQLMVSVIARVMEEAQSKGGSLGVAVQRMMSEGGGT